MINFDIVVVPPGGGEAEFSSPTKGNRIPQPGEYIQLREFDGTSIFIVRNVISIFEDDKSPVRNFSEQGITVEVEPVNFELQSPSQTKMIEKFKNRGINVKEFIPSGY
jgi:hypothetical protein